MNSTQSGFYVSKVDTWLAAVMVVAALAAIAASGLLLVVPVPGAWIVVVTLLALTVGLPLWIFSTTRYLFEGSALLIRSGPFRWSVPIGEIKAVSATRNPLSSPALSLDRILIEYGQAKSIMVSPQDQQGFLAELKARRQASA
jgi:membrane protein YdbS with pleckstrin-like domain